MKSASAHEQRSGEQNAGKQSANDVLPQFSSTNFFRSQDFERIAHMICKINKVHLSK